jgi:hypothetical protein
MRNIRRVIAIFLLLILYAYIVNVSSFPSRILVYSESALNLRLCPFLRLDGNTQVVSTNHSSNYNLSLSLGNTKLKEVSLTIADKVNVVPVRKTNWFEIVYRWCNGSTDFQK